VQLRNAVQTGFNQIVAALNQIINRLNETDGKGSGNVSPPTIPG
jgi:hypothetical protein